MSDRPLLASLARASLLTACTEPTEGPLARIAGAPPRAGPFGATAPPRGGTAALADPPRDRMGTALRQHLAALRSRLPPGRAFTVFVEPLFAVVGDGPAESVRRFAERTVRWAVRWLKHAFFARDPVRVLEIWLFDGDESYRRGAREIFGDEVSTPFGCFSAAHGALVMNIATGGGTLVHEIVHPHMAENFPDCPAWFSEGLASLHEQSSERDGGIVGLVNWRLRGLVDAIRSGRNPSLGSVAGSSTEQFYRPGSELRHATARHLLYWPQERGSPRAF
ncbi:MAG: hypothetical protein Fur0037_20550 [Planctomycetota bacterium]